MRKKKIPPNCSWLNTSARKSIACLAQVALGCSLPVSDKARLFPDQGIKVWVICIDFMCCYAAPVMLISLIHKLLFKMSLQLISSAIHQYCGQRSWLLTLRAVVLFDAPQGPADSHFLQISTMGGVVSGSGQ